MKKITVLGGGFAGVEVAGKLSKSGFDVTLISDRDYFYIYPVSIWIPTGAIDFKDACIDLPTLAKKHKFKLIVDRATAISVKNNSITLESGKIINDYDYLVIALGADKVKTPGIGNTKTICGSPKQSIEIHDAISRLVKKGSGSIAIGFGGNPKDPSAVRGGPGFEMMFNIHHMLKKHGIRDKFELNAFAPMKQPGIRMGEHALKTMDKIFDRYKINKYFGKRIKKFEPGAVIFADDSRLDADFTMFIPAGTGHHLAVNSDLPTSEAGFIKINEFCEVEIAGKPTNVYAIGDAAALEGPDWRAKQGHLAEAMAKNAAFNIVERTKGTDKRKSYIAHINILCIMDTADGAGLIFRNTSRAFMLPLPVIGHWIKKGWGWYARHSKLRHIPRLPGM